MTFIKICGITNLEDAICAVEAGADALGFNFYRPSPRYLSPASARQIIDRLPKHLLKVGVFVNEDAQIVKSVVSEAGITAVQLHGDESPEYCAGLNGYYVIKALAVDDQFSVDKPLKYPSEAVMLDASHKKLRGGTGQTIDWALAKRVNDMGVMLYLAGGLSTDNVLEAIKIVNPHAVDVCTALEDSPGKKNPESIRAFCRVIRNAETT